MKYVKGDLWSVNEINWSRVVTTNIGWDPQQGYCNNMGAGTVMEAARRARGVLRNVTGRDPLGLPALYGVACSILGNSMPTMDLETLIWLNDRLGGHRLPPKAREALLGKLGNLIFLPVKPVLDPIQPWLSWNQRASLPLIERSLHELALMPGKIALTLPGCGNGDLSPQHVYPMCKRILADDRFLLIDSRTDWEPPQ